MTQPIQLGRSNAAELPDTFTDPVCKMLVTPKTAAAKYDWDGKTYYFCMVDCRDRFAEDPNKFLGTHSADNFGHGSAIQDPRSEIEFTCPMHPEIVQIGPGSCPICGMALEPNIVSLEDLPDTEYLDMKRRLWISAILTLPVFALAMAEMLPTFHEYRSPRASIWMQFILATPVVFWGGWPFFQRAWASIKNVSPNMFTLIAMGTGAAYLLSVAALLIPDLFPAAMRDAHTGLVHTYFESAAVITTLVLLGQVLELKARSQTSRDQRTASTCTGNGDCCAQGWIRGNGRPSTCASGYDLRVRLMRKSRLTAKLLKALHRSTNRWSQANRCRSRNCVGSKVIGGTINGNRPFLMRAEKVGSETMLSQIVQMVGEAQRSRAPIQRLADVVSSYFVPAVIIVAVIAFIAWLMLGSLSYAIVAAVSVLILPARARWGSQHRCRSWSAPGTVLKTVC